MIVSLSAEVTLTIHCQPLLDRFQEEYFGNDGIDRPLINVVGPDGIDFLNRCLTGIGQSVMLEGADHIQIMGDRA